MYIFFGQDWVTANDSILILWLNSVAKSVGHIRTLFPYLTQLRAKALHVNLCVKK